MTILRRVAATAFALLALAAGAEEKKPVSGPAPAPVVVWNREIVVLRGTFEGADPAVRAARAERRLLNIETEAAEYRVEAKPATIGSYTGVSIQVNGKPIFGLLTEDADREQGEAFEHLTAQTLRNIEDWLAARAEQRVPMLLARHIGLTLLATLLYVALLIALVRLSDRLRIWISTSHAARAKALVAAGIDVRPYLVSLEAGLVKLLAWVAGLAMTYLWITYVLREFPYTRPWGGRLTGYLVETLTAFASAIVRSIPDLFAVLVIVLLTRLLAGIVNQMFRSVQSGMVRLSWLEPEVASITRRLILGFLWVFALVMAYPYIPGSGTDAFKGVSVLIGLMVSLGSAGLVGQVIGGLVVVYNRSLRIGEYVTVSGHEGTVTEIGLLSSRLLTRNMEEVTIPNAVLVASTVTNFSRRAGLGGTLATTTVTIGYDAPWRQVHAMLREAARRTAGVEQEPEPRIVQRSLSDFYVEYELWVRIRDATERVIVLGELHANIQDAFNEYGVQILSPHYMMQPERAVTVPKDKWAPPPAKPDKA